jgi:hypothetical protein
LSVAPQNRWNRDDVGHASRYSGLLHVEVSQTSVFQSGLKTGRCVTTGGAHGTIAEVALSQVEDGRVDAMDYIESCYPCFTIFFLLGSMGIVVFCLDL